MQPMPPTNAVFNQDDVIVVDRAKIDELKARSLTADRQVFRLCLHPNPEAGLHEMLIVHQKDAYVKPHKHFAKSESFHVIEGELDVFLFDDSGAITRKIELGEYRSGKPFCYRLSAPVFHTVLPKSAQVVFHETTDGPFKREETLFSAWSPEEKDTAAVQRFLAGLKNFRG